MFTPKTLVSLKTVQRKKLLTLNRENAFWDAYRRIELGLSFSEEEFEKREDVIKTVESGIEGCINVLEISLEELVKKANISSGTGFEEKLWALAKAGLLPPLLLNDTLDVYRYVKNAQKSQKRALMYYTALVRIMEVIEACWKYVEKEIARFSQLN